MRRTGQPGAATAAHGAAAGAQEVAGWPGGHALGDRALRGGCCRQP